MSYTVSLTIDDVIGAVATALEPFCPGAEIIQSQVNRVAMPLSPFVELTPIITSDLSVPAVVFDDTTQASDITGPKQIEIQIDFYGPDAGDQCNAVKTVIRSQAGYSLFPEAIRPLYSDNGVQSIMVSGEEQYVSRWTLRVQLQYNPVVSIPQDSAIVLSPDVLPPI
jgi:hypothetical protein